MSDTILLVVGLMGIGWGFRWLPGAAWDLLADWCLKPTYPGYSAIEWPWLTLGDLDVDGYIREETE